MTPPAATHRPSGVTVALLVTLAWAAIALPPILAGNLRGRGAYDQVNFHEPAIRQFIRDWPSLHFGDYASATTPGFHVAVAGAGKALGDDPRTLRIAGSLFTLAFWLLLTNWCARRAGWLGVAAALPCLASMHTVFPAIWLLPDNAGWLGVLGVLILSTPRATSNARLLGAGIALALLVFARQSHLWAAGAIWAAGLQASVIGRPRWGPLITAIAVTLPAFAIVAWFAFLWGGLVAPQFQGQYHGWSAAAPAFVLANLGIASLFFVGFLARPFVALWKSHPGVILSFVLAGLLLALLPPTTYSDFNNQRISGLWNIARRAPVVAGHTSVVMLLLAPLGAAACAAWLGAIAAHARLVWSASLAAFIAAQVASPACWQRYTEPMVLILCALGAALVPAPRVDGPQPPLLEALSGRAARFVGPLAFAVLLALLTSATIAGAKPL